MSNLSAKLDQLELLDTAIFNLTSSLVDGQLDEYLSVNPLTGQKYQKSPDQVYDKDLCERQFDSQSISFTQLDYVTFA